jgi:hypothetical protein
MTVFKELDLVKTTEAVDVWVADDSSRSQVPAGMVGAVVMVYGAPNAPVAYELEFHLAGRSSFALATVEARYVTSP